MNLKEERIRLLQQIPVFALRQLLNEVFTGEQGESALKERFKILNRKPRLVRKAVMRLTRQELTALIQASPEIEDAVYGEVYDFLIQKLMESGS